MSDLKLLPLEILSINGNYLVTFHEELTSLLEKLEVSPDSFILIDSQVANQYEQIMRLLPIERYMVIQSLESNKSLTTVSDICEWLMSLGASKTSHLIGIGGGIIQDLSTFSSHIYFRGINWTYVPTTLLSQADSCVGAKCALNLKGHKNQLGVVHTPSAIEVYEGFLKTLPFSEIQSGFGEIAKLAVTGERQFLNEFVSYLHKEQFSTKNIGEIIRLSLAAKKFIVDQDEYESDLRRILNYGHSFGHALEALTENSVVHGDAVVVGMDLINYIGLKQGITEPEFYNEMKSLFNNHFSHVKVNQTINAKIWVNELKHDKKMKFGKMNFAIPVSTGNIKIYTMELDEVLVDLVGDYIGQSAFFNTA